MAGANCPDSLQRLISLCRPPQDPASSKHSRPHQAARTIPPSHDDLTQVYGTGCFDEFLWIFADGADNGNLDIGACTDEMQSILRSKEASALRASVATYDVTLENLVQWGVTDNADTLMWIPAGDPANWPTIIIQAGQLDFTISDRSSTGVVLSLLTGELHIPFFPADFPSRHPEFSINPYA
jgi:hypothetical protein